MQKVERLSDNLSSIERDFQGQSESFFGVHEGQGIEEAWENAEMRIEDRKRLVLGVRKAPDRVSVLFSRGWAKLSSVTTVYWIPLSWAALPFVIALLFVGTLYGLRYFSGETEVFPPFWDREADLHRGDRGGGPLASTSLLTLQDSEAERPQPAHLWASPRNNVCKEQVNQSWCDIPPRITWYHQPSSFQGLLAPVLPLRRQSKVLPTLEGGSSTWLRQPGIPHLPFVPKGTAWQKPVAAWNWVEE